jgi:hypothetical protein
VPLKFAYVLTCGILGLVVLMFRGDRAKDAAGFGQCGALAVLAVLHRSVVVVIGAPARAWVLPASYTHQRSTAGPCRDRCPGERLLSLE